MPVTQELIDELWSGLVVTLDESPEEMARLISETDDPVAAAGIKLDEIESYLRERYENQMDFNGFMSGVQIMAMGFGTISVNGEGNLTTYRRDGSHDGDNIYFGFTAVEEKTGFAYLKEKGTNTEDMPLVFTYMNLFRIFRGAVRDLVNEVNEEIGKTRNKLILPQVIENPKSFDPSPTLKEDGRQLTYEVWNRPKDDREGNGFASMDRFEASEIGRLKYFLDESTSSGHIEYGSLSDNDARLMSRYVEIGLFSHGKEGYEPNLPDMATSSVLVYNNKTPLKPSDVRSLSDIEGLFAVDVV
jgi:hypothetical protein